MNDPANREFDVLVWGATGFTGSLVCEYLLQQYGVDGELRWAMAGRSEHKLEKLRRQLGQAAATIPLMYADGRDRDSLDQLVKRSRVVLTTVGPYALYGSELVAACSAAGTHYCDLSAEVQWIRRMMDAHQSTAADSGARIVHCCGFDSIPSDLGVWFLQQQAMEQLGGPCQRVKLRVRAMKGGASGGTVASLLNVLEESKRDPDVARLLKNPFSLCPPDHQKGPRQPHGMSAKYDPDVRSWTAPFVMAGINTKVVHRSNALLGHAYGEDFVYDETVMTGAGARGRLKAYSMTGGLGAFVGAAAIKPSRTLMQKLFLPKPGEGPNQKQRDTGFFNIMLVGKTRRGRQIQVRVTGDRDPGYGSTSKMLSESAICLARNSNKKNQGGFWTPATAMGAELLEQLQQKAGLSFGVETVD